MDPPLVVDLRTRDRQPELMDEPDLDPSVHRRALRALERVNRWTGSSRILWSSIAAAEPLRRRRPLKVLDVACGGGDVIAGLKRRADRAGVAVEFAGCDISPTAVDHARRRSRERGVDAEFFEHDVLRAPLPRGYDVILCSLFLHHLQDEEAVELLREMGEAAESLVLASDLVRSRTGYLWAWLGVRAISRCRIVHVDGPRSVAAAFTPSEMRFLAEQAGLNGVRLARYWPCRMLLSWSKP